MRTRKIHKYSTVKKKNSPIYSVLSSFPRWNGRWSDSSCCSSLQLNWRAMPTRCQNYFKENISLSSWKMLVSFTLIYFFQTCKFQFKFLIIIAVSSLGRDWKKCFRSRHRLFGLVGWPFRLAFGKSRIWVSWYWTQLNIFLSLCCKRNSDFGMKWQVHDAAVGWFNWGTD